MDELLAGRELDAEIDCQVFGVTYWAPDWIHSYYSTSPTAAWRVIERLQALGWWCEIKTPFEPGEPYWVGFTPHGVTGWNGQPDHKDYGYTMPLATCRAALATVGAVETRYGGLAARVRNAEQR